MRRFVMILGLTALAATTVVFSAGAAPEGDKAKDGSNGGHVRYAAEQKLLRPENYREWVYLSSGLGMNYGPSAQGASASPAFTNVYVNPESYRAFLRSGEWPDKTIFALEIYSSATHSDPNKQGKFQDQLMALEAEVKDSSTPEVWRYYDFGTERQEAAALPREGCFACHQKNAAVEHSFAQFYPQLLEIGLKRNKIKPGVHIPLNGKRFTDLALEKGWPAAEAAYMSAKKSGQAQMLDEGALNGIGYRLLASKKNAEAVQAFELVSREYPESANAFDSLAEGYEAAGKREHAISASNKALEILANDKEIPEGQRTAIERSVKERLMRLGATQPVQGAAANMM